METTRTTLLARAEVHYARRIAFRCRYRGNPLGLVAIMLLLAADGVRTVEPAAVPLSCAVALGLAAAISGIYTYAYYYGRNPFLVVITFVLGATTLALAFQQPIGPLGIVAALVGAGLFFVVEQLFRGRRYLLELVRLLDSPNPEVRRIAAEVIGEIGPAAGPKIFSVEGMLTGLSPAAVSAVLALTKLLADPTADVQRSAAEALGHIGPAAAPAVPALTTALAAPDSAVRQAAAEALDRIQH